VLCINDIQYILTVEPDQVALPMVRQEYQLQSNEAMSSLILDDMDEQWNWIPPPMTSHGVLLNLYTLLELVRFFLFLFLPHSSRINTTFNRNRTGRREKATAQEQRSNRSHVDHRARSKSLTVGTEN
jgi:hypothetical protein